MIKEAIGTGASIDEAKAAAMLELGISDSDDFTVEVLQTPAKKFLGLFGGSPAKVKVTFEAADRRPERKERAQKPVYEKKTEKKEYRKNEFKRNANPAPEKAQAQAAEPPLEETNLYPETAEYIKEMVKALGISECEVTEKSNSEEIYFELECGDDYGIIIGKRGETLDAIQYLARMVANKGNTNYKRVSINVGNYRAKREETLKILARKTASKAVRQGRSISLEPMNPYERRIIHTAVQEVEGAVSHSVGSDLDRRVVIMPADGARRQNGGRPQRNGGYNNRDRGPRREKREPYKPEIAPDRAPKSDIDGAGLYGKVEIPAKTEE